MITSDKIWVGKETESLVCIFNEMSDVLINISKVDCEVLKLIE